ncbi:DUF6412 domain-containing protein [Streptomyces sp. 549]|uniref:DUF6412 domain-containing protein n=1 Tax=Streptomyces sp. 549 TaxID=3049076 RepID=UPI0024C393F8|nr:DUF6412 domain-containing protein [Streptomyces sp. 549]MDK1472063.1 DUF6412 domain-containing protein [Streptomyces sp. 549]
MSAPARRLAALTAHILVLLLLLTDVLVGPVGLAGAVALAAAALAALPLLCAALAGHRAAANVPARVRTTLRDRAVRCAFLPQRDPDAAGRPRPRAPGLRLPAVA